MTTVSAQGPSLAFMNSSLAHQCVNVCTHILNTHMHTPVAVFENSCWGVDIPWSVKMPLLIVWEGERGWESRSKREREREWEHLVKTCEAGTGDRKTKEGVDRTGRSKDKWGRGRRLIKKEQQDRRERETMKKRKTTEWKRERKENRSR